MTTNPQPAMTPDSRTRFPSKSPELWEPPNAEDAEDSETGETPLSSSSGILIKKSQRKKRVTFRDYNLVHVREIPPRPHSDEVSDPDDVCDEDVNDDDDDDDDDDEEEYPDDDSDSSSESDTEDDVSKESQLPSSMVPDDVLRKPTSSAPGNQKQVSDRPEWKNAPSCKSPSDLSASPSSRHGATSATPSVLSKPKLLTPSKVAVPGKKKVRKLTPILEVSPLSSGTNLYSKSGVKSVKKKRAYPRKPDGTDKRKLTSPLRVRVSKQAVNKVGVVSVKNKVHSDSVNNKVGMVSVKNKHSSTSASPFNPPSVSSAKDILTLPPLAVEDYSVARSSRALKQLSIGQVYSLGGFIFPENPSNELASGTPSLSTTTLSEIENLPLPVQASVNAPSYASRQERISSAPTASVSGKKRYYAWQKANGIAQSQTQETPCIALMWDNTPQTPPPVTKPGPLMDRACAWYPTFLRNDYG